MNIADGRKLSQAWKTAKVANDKAGGLFLDSPRRRAGQAITLGSVNEITGMRLKT
jgi:hypothetical protein